MTTKIEWVKNPDGTKGETWNPVTGCTKVSEGCAHCYAERMSKRLAGRYGYPEAPDNFKVTLHLDRLDEPYRWRKPRRVFVCSMGDLFHRAVEMLDSTFLREVFAVMALCPQHTFQLLTKRPHIAKEQLTDGFAANLEWAILGICDDKHVKPPEFVWPLPNVWLGVTAENQRCADERITILLQIPAAIHFVSIEPMLGAVILDDVRPNRGTPKECSIDALRTQRHLFVEDDWSRNKLDWVICGGETGPGARPMHPDWARALQDQCQMAGVPFFFKHWGEWKAISGKNPQGVIEFQRASKGKACQVSGSPLVLWRVGKKRAGRLLGGREYEQYPEVAR